jgi:rifampicin phosphotransferase
MHTAQRRPPSGSIAGRCITPLHDVTNATEHGEKACRLGEMTRLGHPVPKGIVISGNFFIETLRQDDTQNFINARVRDLVVENLTDVADASCDIEARIMKVELPEAFREHLAEMASPLLKHGPVAVRSSACGEDSGDAAFAGQLDTFLGINTLPALGKAVLRCWASYWSHRALAYQLARKVQLTSMGVIIQTQVDPRFSGVLFTRNVQSPATNQLVLEYCEGLGEKLVSGEITPISLILDPNGHVLHETSHTSDPATEPKTILNDSNVRSQDETVSQAPNATASQHLPPALIEQLAHTGRQLETQFDHPQDIEWSVDQANAIYILQSRPITTMEKPKLTVVWSNANVNENFPDPICPLLYSVASFGYYHYFRNMAIAFGVARVRIDSMEYPLRNIIGTHAGRMYYNLSNIHAVLRAVPFGEFLAESFNQFVGSESTVKNHESPSWKSLSRGKFSELRETFSIARRAAGRFRNLERGITQFEVTVDQFAADSEPALLSEFDTSELLVLWRRFISIRSNWTDAAMADAASMIYYRLTGSFLAREFKSDDDRAMVNRLLSGLCDIVSGLPTEKLWNISRSIRKNPSLAEAFAMESPETLWQRIETDDSLKEIAGELKDFLDHWGFRCSGELMLTTASYQEAPATLLPVLASFVQIEGPSPREHLETQKKLREQTTQRILKELHPKSAIRFLPYPRKNQIASWLLRATQRSVACRERARLKQALLYSRVRRIALAIGERLTQENRLNHVDDIFFLTYQEIEELLAGSSMLPNTIGNLADLRRTEFKLLAECTPPDRLEIPAGQYWQPNETLPTDRSGDEEWNEGIGVSGGRIVGRAVVLTSPDQFAEVAKGDILVTRQTDPGWGPILFLVRGLVMERGGMLSHGAILAREYGIPTAVAIQDATQRIKTGDTIKVDGDLGRVEIVS